MAKDDPPEGTWATLQLRFVGDGEKWDHLYLAQPVKVSELLTAIRDNVGLPVRIIEDGAVLDTVINTRNLTMATLVPVEERQ
jgi:hypothetical protein